MKTTVKTTSDSKSKEDTPSSTRRTNDDKLNKSVYTVSTPRSYVPKSTTADIYAQKKRSTIQGAKAPKKIPGTSYSSSSVSPMKDILKSSPSSVSQISRSTDKNSKKKLDAKATSFSARKNEIPKKKDLFMNVIVNSPVAKRRLDLNKEHETTKSLTREVSNVKQKEKSTKEFEKIRNENPKSFSEKEVLNIKNDNPKKDDTERQRTKTRTLNENEVKMLTPDVVDNNAEMLSLSRKLTAKPKAFYVDLDGESSKAKPQRDKSSDEEVSYEDDFESYESDFDSYHSEQSQSNHSSDQIDDREGCDEIWKTNDCQSTSVEESFKEIRDEERMLDSGSFHLRDQRSAKMKPVVMDYIQEDVEDGGYKKTSLTDEGFQEMSSSSAVSSLRTSHVDVLDRPLFIDFTKSKENKRKRRINERLKQRANDLLSMITLHEMSYSLFEMKPISYDLYMATFGRSNYKQSGVQTFDDGISEEVQTEEVMCSHKWTQNPVEFSKHDIYLNKESKPRKYSENFEDYIIKFTHLVKQNCEVEINNVIKDENYKMNPLRIYFEQKDGVGTGDMLPYEAYKSKLKNNGYNSDRLRKFLKKFDSRISHVLSINTRLNNDSDLVTNTKFPFSKGYVSVSPKTIKDEKLLFLRISQVTSVILSQTKSNLIMTVHKKVDTKKCVICLWDISVAVRDPVKILIAIDNVVIGKFIGNTDGIFVAALEDGSIHVWDLLEEPTWRDDVANKESTTELVEVSSEPFTEAERDRQWNLRNINVGINQFQIQCALQACAYTSSAYNMSNGDVTDCIVGLELNCDAHAPVSQDSGRKIIGQVISLQRIGIITIWCIGQEKTKKCTPDIGKAFWSKIKLEKSQTILLQEYVDVTFMVNTNNDETSNFNLHAAKRRLSSRKQEKNVLKREFSHPQTAVRSDFEFDRPTSAASINGQMLPAKKNVAKSWESGIVCNDFKIMRLNNVDNYLVGKNWGEVIRCRRYLGTVKVDRFCVASDMSSVTCLKISPHGLPYFLAATDTGTVNLCSLLDSRVLLTLDCRNVPQNQSTDKCQSDHKGRYMGSVAVRMPSGLISTKISVMSVLWSQVNPCCIYAMMQDGAFFTFELTHSDIYAKSMCEKAATACDASDTTLALLTPEGEVQAHRLINEHRTKEYLELFEKYVALL